MTGTSSRNVQMPAPTSNTSIGDFLEEDVFPRLTADQVFTHPAHQFHKNNGKWRGDCPWHESKSRTSFTVTPETLQWYCPGCDEGGYVLEYFAKISGSALPVRGEDFIRFGKQAAELAGVKFPTREITPEEQEYARLQDVRRDLIDWVVKDSQARLWSDEGTAALDYLRSRSFTDDQIKALQFGLFGRATEMRRRLSECFERGDVNQSKVFVTLMNGYIVTPWYDAHGRLLTLYGRWPGNPPGEKPKTTALPGDGTKRSPFCFDRARAARETNLVLVEGLLDAAQAQAHGMTNVVACVGASLSYAQVDTLKRHRVESVTIALDPDSAGEKGILSCINNLDRAGISAYVAPTIPDGMDPDEFIALEGIDAFKRHVADGQHGYRYRANRIVEEHLGNASDAGKATVVTKARRFAEQPGRNGDALATFFWPVIEEATGAMSDSLGGTEPAPATTPGTSSAKDRAATLDDFRAYMPEHRFIFIPDGGLWPASSVNKSLPAIPTGRFNDKGKEIYESAADWLDRNRPVQQMTWAPGEDMLISDRLITHGGWFNHRGATCFNLYRPPTIKPGDPEKALHWINHVRKVYPDDADHIIKWLAHRVQNPGDKINHALVLGGAPGIGKDTLLEPVKYAIGPWNFQEVSPSHMLGRFNGFVKSVILRISEARDLGDINRYSFYEHMKSYTAAPPDVLRVDEKNRNEYAVFNVCGVVLTTNHKTAGIYLPADDRRHYVAWSELEASDFTEEKWNFLYRWFAEEGNGHVAAYLATLDISDFNPKAPPRKTPAFWDIVDANRSPEDAEIADVLDKITHDDAVSLSQIIDRADTSLAEWLQDRKNSRSVPHRMESVGYVRVRNEAAKDGLWVVNGKRQAIYAKGLLDPRDRLIAAKKLTERRY